MSDCFEFTTKTFGSIYETEQGQKIWKFLNKPTSVDRMKAVSDVGKPALLGVEDSLIDSFQVQEKASVTEKDKAQFYRLKQMLGAMVRQVMEAHGYKLKASNVKVPNSKVFFSASRYTKATQPQEIAGQELRLKSTKPRRSLAELLAATPDGLQRVEGWDEMPAAGNER